VIGLRVSSTSSPRSCLERGEDARAGARRKRGVWGRRRNRVGTGPDPRSSGPIRRGGDVEACRGRDRKVRAPNPLGGAHAVSATGASAQRPRLIGEAAAARAGNTAFRPRVVVCLRTSTSGQLGGAAHVGTPGGRSATTTQRHLKARTLTAELGIPRGFPGDRRLRTSHESPVLLRSYRGGRRRGIRLELDGNRSGFRDRAGQAAAAAFERAWAAPAY